jgi:hypothetical protein
MRTSGLQNICNIAFASDILTKIGCIIVAESHLSRQSAMPVKYLLEDIPTGMVIQKAYRKDGRSDKRLDIRAP